MIADILVVLLILLGTVFIGVAGYGIIKMPDVYTRMSVVTKAVTLGVGTIMVAVVVHFNDTIVMLKIVSLIAFLLFSLSVAAHVIGLTAYRDGNKLWGGTFRNEFQIDIDKEKRENEKSEIKSNKENQTKTDF